jgi:hypothetical protein
LFWLVVVGPGGRPCEIGFAEVAATACVRGRRCPGPEIAAELSVSPNTVSAHIRSIYAKLGVRDRSSAVQRARELRLLAAAGRLR